MRHVQGYLGSHWMPPSGGYLLRIAPTAARAMGKQSTINKYTYFAGCFLMAMAMRRYNTARISQWRRSRASLEVTGHRHRASIMSDNILKRTWLRQFFLMFFIIKTVEKGHRLILRPLFSIGVLHIKGKRRA
jgi:hypothetical protein